MTETGHMAINLSSISLHKSKYQKLFSNMIHDGIAEIATIYVIQNLQPVWIKFKLKQT